MLRDTKWRERACELFEEVIQISSELMQFLSSNLVGETYAHVSNL